MAENGAPDGGAAAANTPQQLRGRSAAVIALLASLCIDAALLAAAYDMRVDLRFVKAAPALPPFAAGDAWPYVVRHGPAAALAVHVIVALVALARLASAPRQRRAQAAPKAAKARATQSMPHPPKAEASAPAATAPPATLPVAEAVRVFDAAAVTARMAAADAAAAAARTPSPPKAKPAAKEPHAVEQRGSARTPGGSAARESRWVESPRAGASTPTKGAARVVHSVRL